MSQILPSDSQRVQDFLLSKGSTAKVQLLSNTAATANDAATALGVDVHQIGKSIVFGTGMEVVVVVICGDQRVDVARLSKAVEVDHIGPLKATEVRARTHYVIGGVSPFALPRDVTLIIDSELYDCDDCFVAAGHPRTVVRTSGRDLTKLTGARVEPIAEPGCEVENDELDDGGALCI